MDRVRKGELPWTKIDDLHRMILEDLLDRFGIGGLGETGVDQLNRAWHRLKPWPDAVEGLTRLKSRYTVATLSNGNVSLLTNMAKHSGLPWDVILSADLAGHYKPDPEVYLTAVDLLGLRPGELMMVAAHEGDLNAARSVGYRTAFVHRPLEYGPSRRAAKPADCDYDVVVDDFSGLAEVLGV